MVRTEMLKKIGSELRIFLVEEHLMVRQAVKELIHKHSAMKVTGEAEDFPTALAGIQAAQPDVVVTDVSMKSGDGLELIKILRKTFPNVRVVVLSMHDERLYACPAVQAGAMGYVMKERPLADLLAAIENVSQGRLYLNPDLMHSLVAGKMARGFESPVNDHFTDREKQVLQLIGQWRRPHEIAQALQISIKTVDYYRNKIKDKLSLSSTAEVTRYAIEVFGSSQPKTAPRKSHRSTPAKTSFYQAAY
jgi:DNA-binding NarL/FixJ family response regulator